MQEEADVVVVGSGAAGLLSAIRATDLGLATIMIEKAHSYGGTSATSGGGMWIPDHGLQGHVDSTDLAMTYLKHVTRGQVAEERLRAFVDNGKRMVAYLGEIGIHCQPLKSFPDYFPEAPGTVPGRSVFPPELDGGELGSEFFLMREPFFQSLLFERYSLDIKQAGAILSRKFGWQFVALKVFLKYWLDLGQRVKSRRDRRCLRGAALVGALRKELLKRKVSLYLDTPLAEILVENKRVTGVVVNRGGKLRTVKARRGVILAAGGFEHNQSIRDATLPVKTNARSSLTPPGANTGDALAAATAIGAATEFMDCMWWAPVIYLPLDGRNADVPYSMTNDQRHPNSIMVNRNGERFVNESCSYDQFGIAVVVDQRRTGANAPCWMIFDANYRRKYACGGILPNVVMPDRKIPQHWWDQYIYRAGTISELADKISIAPDRLEGTVRQFNDDAANGVDTVFGRGKSQYDRHFGDPSVKPNPCLGPVDKAPFYAVRIELGDLGSKGGLKANANAQIVHRDGQPIVGLYAVGNSSGCAFGDCYPGGGGTLGPAMTFGFVASNHIAAEQ